MILPKCFLTRPIAHRGLHDVKSGILENSASAFKAAISANYGIELDVQLSADDDAMVFHDYDLRRLTDQSGPIRMRATEELAKTSLGGSSDGINTLGDILELIAGQVPVLIELKDQDGMMGPAIGPLEEAVASALENYEGPAAVMSFNPHSVARLADLCPETPRGIVTSSFEPDEWPLSAQICETLRDIPDYTDVGACFISHQAADLARPRVADLKSEGATILCWTIRSSEEERKAREIADNVTFEGYLPA